MGVPSGQVEDVVVRGDAARVRAGSDTVFLREPASGWRVAGAGCRAVDGRPYACDVGGP
ncbi:hypothetical protein AB0I60_00465 [Actinosynnema sp. NPDC050436]|uniref:hypothetical protein n=1 Tax=Actinosynnema sp. NPDC050436 TaxID=3155659 RepID=UPI0033DC9747